ncbi:MAG: hypothetical protein JNM78_06085 [Cyclobacteriaceae bacterium]|nr:hypothetical protein [Cyclobacteriaceae bacterium]
MKNTNTGRVYPRGKNPPTLVQSSANHEWVSSAVESIEELFSLEGNHEAKDLPNLAPILIRQLAEKDPPKQKTAFLLEILRSSILRSTIGLCLHASILYEWHKLAAQDCVSIFCIPTGKNPPNRTAFLLEVIRNVLVKNTNIGRATPTRAEA